MSEPEKLPAGTSGQDPDPLLKDFEEKKQRLRQNVGLLAVELKEARSRLASQEVALLNETLMRKEAEIKTKLLEDEIFLLRRRLEEQDQELQASASTSLKYENELDELRCRFDRAQAAANESEEKKNRSLKHGEDDRINRVEEQLEIIWRELREREATQNQLKDKIRKIEQDIMQLVIVTLVSKDRELRRTLDEVLDVKNKTEIVSCHLELKTGDLESQLKERCVGDQEIRDRVLKLELQLEQASDRSLTRQFIRLHTRLMFVVYVFVRAVWMKLRGLASLSSLVYGHFIEWLWAYLRNYIRCSIIWNLVVHMLLYAGFGSSIYSQKHSSKGIKEMCGFFKVC